MIKYIALLALLISAPAYGVHIVSHDAKVDIKTEKIARLYNNVDHTSVGRYLSEVLATADLPGDRVVYINSPGGEVDSGKLIIDTMEIERSHGVRQVCVVLGEATSMAFNILTHCDVRLATGKSTFLVHKIRYLSMPPGVAFTAKYLREIAADLDTGDEPYRQANAKAMHLPLSIYDKAADAETTWSATELRSMNYLHGIVKIK